MTLEISILNISALAGMTIIFMYWLDFTRIYYTQNDTRNDAPPWLMGSVIFSILSI